MKFELPELNYAYDALVPTIDAQTMEIHHGKHHNAYTANLNNLLEEHNVADIDIEEMLANISSYPAGIRNNAGGFYNHNLFWTIMTPGGSEMSAELETMIVDSFGSVEAMKEQFAQAAATRFGSGWAWLSVKKGKLVVTSTANQDNPLMDVVSEAEGVMTPVLGLDVWEHAYYLNYQNRRPDYIGAWWDVVNWAEVERRINEA